MGPEIGKISGFDISMQISIDKQTGDIHARAKPKDATDAKALSASKDVFSNENLTFTREVLQEVKELLVNPDRFTNTTAAPTDKQKIVDTLFQAVSAAGNKTKESILRNIDVIDHSIGVQLGLVAPKSRQPESFTVEGKNDPDSLEKMNTKSFGRREVDIGRYIRTGQLTVKIEGKASNTAANDVEKMTETLNSFAKFVKLDEQTTNILLKVNQMTLNGKIDPEKTQGHFDSNKELLTPYTDKAGPLHNAVSQGAMIDLGTVVFNVCNEKVGVLEGGDRVTVSIVREHILVEHAVTMHGKVFDNAQSKEVADPNGPKQFIGNTTIVGTRSDDGKITWGSVTKSAHILPNEKLKKKDFIDLQDKLDKAGLLTSDQKETLEMVKKSRSDATYNQLAARATENANYQSLGPTPNPLYKGK